MYARNGDRSIYFNALASPAAASMTGRTSCPVVLSLHGGPGFAHDYLLTGLQSLASQTRLYMVDLPGAGKSSRHPGSGYPLASFVADVEAVRLCTDAERIVLLGHCWGALLAIEYAIAHPRAVAAVIAVNPIRILRAEGQDAEAQARAIAARDPDVVEPYLQQLWPLIQRALAGETDAWQVIDASPWWVRMWRTQFCREPPQEWEAAVSGMRFGLEAYFAYKGAAMLSNDHPLARYDLADRASQLDVPMLIVASDSDANYVAPPSIHALPLYEAARHAELSILPGQGHFPFAEDTLGFGRLVHDYLCKTLQP